MYVKTLRPAVLITTVSSRLDFSQNETSGERKTWVGFMSALRGRSCKGIHVSSWKQRIFCWHVVAVAFQTFDSSFRVVPLSKLHSIGSFFLGTTRLTHTMGEKCFTPRAYGYFYINLFIMSSRNRLHNVLRTARDFRIERQRLKVDFLFTPKMIYCATYEENSKSSEDQMFGLRVEKLSMPTFQFSSLCLGVRAHQHNSRALFRSILCSTVWHSKGAYDFVWRNREQFFLEENSASKPAHQVAKFTSSRVVNFHFHGSRSFGCFGGKNWDIDNDSKQKKREQVSCRSFDSAEYLMRNLNSETWGLEPENVGFLCDQSLPHCKSFFKMKSCNSRVKNLSRMLWFLFKPITSSRISWAVS